MSDWNFRWYPKLALLPLPERCDFPVDVAHEDGVLELDVRLVLVLQLLRVEGPHAGPKLEVSI